MNKSANAMKVWLKDNKIQKGQFALALGISKPSMSRLIRGHQVPSIELALRIEQQTGGKVRVRDWTLTLSDTEATA